MRPGRAAALVIVALLAIGSGFHLAESFVEQRAAVTAAETTLASLRARRLDSPEAEARRKALAEPPVPQAGLLAGDGDAEAASRLEAVIRAAVEAHGAEIQAVPLSHGSAEDGLRVVRASLRLTADAEHVAPLLLALKTGLPALFVERLKVSRRSSGAEDEPAGLDLVATLAAYRDVPSGGGNPGHEHASPPARGVERRAPPGVLAGLQP